jgi:hypothetical protein
MQSVYKMLISFLLFVFLVSFTLSSVAGDWGLAGTQFDNNLKISIVIYFELEFIRDDRDLHCLSICIAPCS